MKIFLAGTPPYWKTGDYDDIIKKYRPFVLDSAAYISEWSLKMKPWYGDYLLDSGAFTFRQQSKKELDWITYIKQYAELIRTQNIDKFFELDIDNLVGYKTVLKYRDLLEQEANRPCIPVWHPNRGKEDFIATVKQYKYVALGGIVGVKSRDPQRMKYRELFPNFIKLAHENGCKIHGLGFTSMNGIRRCHFDSVDSTSWIYGNKLGKVWVFDGANMVSIDSGQDRRIKDARISAKHSYEEWCKFQKYAEAKL